jgi:predicted Co/Zn/Cd cation transporter (cation efflux family)
MFFIVINGYNLRLTKFHYIIVEVDPAINPLSGFAGLCIHMGHRGKMLPPERRSRW